MYFINFLKRLISSNKYNFKKKKMKSKGTTKSYYKQSIQYNIIASLRIDVSRLLPCSCSVDLSSMRRTSYNFCLFWIFTRKLNSSRVTDPCAKPQRITILSFKQTSYNLQEVCWKRNILQRVQYWINRRWNCWLKNHQVLLGVGNESSNISKCHDEEGDCLDKEKDEEVVFSKHDIVAADKEEVHSNTEF